MLGVPKLLLPSRAEVEPDFTEVVFESPKAEDHTAKDRIVYTRITGEGGEQTVFVVENGEDIPPPSQGRYPLTELLDRTRRELIRRESDRRIFHTIMFTTLTGDDPGTCEL